MLHQRARAIVAGNGFDRRRDRRRRVRIARSSSFPLLLSDHVKRVQRTLLLPSLFFHLTRATVINLTLIAKATAETVQKHRRFFRTDHVRQGPSKIWDGGPTTTTTTRRPLLSSSTLALRRHRYLIIYFCRQTELDFPKVEARRGISGLQARLSFGRWLRISDTKHAARQLAERRR